MTVINSRELMRGNCILYLNELYLVNGIKYEPNCPEFNWRVSFCTINEVEAGGKMRILTNAKMENWIYPVPITRDFLINKCGFIDPANNGWGCRLPVNSVDELCWYLQDELNNDIGIRYQTQGSGFSRNFNVKYVHQLQNLYFTLTGKELEIKF